MSTTRFIKGKLKTKEESNRDNINIPLFLREGQSSKASLLRSMILMEYLSSNTNFPEKNKYISILMQSSEKTLPTSERKKNRKEAIREMSQLFSNMLKQVPENKRNEFLTTISTLSKQIDQSAIDDKSIKKLDQHMIGSYLSHIITKINMEPNPSFYFNSNVANQNKSEPHNTQLLNKTRPAKTFKNLFKRSDQMGGVISKSKEGVSSAVEVEYYKKKGGIDTFFKKAPIMYADSTPEFPPSMRTFYEVVLGNIYNLYVDVPKSRVIDLKTPHVFSHKKNNAVSLSSAEGLSSKLPLSNLFASIIISLALKEQDLKPANMITDFKECYRIDFLYSLQGKGEKYNLDNLEFLNPVYLLERLYFHRASIPSDLLENTLENFDACVLETVNALQTFLNCSDEEALLDKSRLAIKLAHVEKLSTAELNLLGITSELPKDLRQLTDSHRKELDKLTVENLGKIVPETQEMQAFLKKQIVFLQDMETMFDFIRAGVKDGKKNAEKLLGIWQELGPTNNDRLNTLHTNQSHSKFKQNH